MENAEENLDDQMDYVERLYVCGRCGRGKRPEAPRFPPETWYVCISLPTVITQWTKQRKAGIANCKS